VGEIEGGKALASMTQENKEEEEELCEEERALLKSMDNSRLDLMHDDDDFFSSHNFSVRQIVGCKGLKVVDGSGEGRVKEMVVLLFILHFVEKSTN